MELKIGSRGRLTLPAAMLEHLGVKRGDELEGELQPNGVMVLRKASDSESDDGTEQAE
jgi:bifunctional DNA-binding transcriptional regulator/antitoxin component of YhaV-PrlF toxin-antitoxin module